MGFSYGINPLTGYSTLCCDFCGRNKGEVSKKTGERIKSVIKIECPYGYCQAWATCENCRAEKLNKQCSCSPDNITHEQLCKPRKIENLLKEIEAYAYRCKQQFLFMPDVHYSVFMKEFYTSKKLVDLVCKQLINDGKLKSVRKDSVQHTSPRLEIVTN